MNLRQHGMVLLTTIIMIVILTLLVLTLMQAVFLYIKVSNQVVIKHEALYQLESVAKKIAMVNDGLHSSGCIFTETNPNEIVEMLLKYRECSLTNNDRQYFYLIDDLGLFPCLQIVSGEKTYSSHHWLITVATAPPRQDVLQLRIARPAKTIACDLGEERQIDKGVINWRYLPYVAH